MNVDPAPIDQTSANPGSAPDPSSDALKIDRINELTGVGRTNWLGLLAYLAFVSITLMGVEDADFFIDTRQTTLPLVGVSIPTFSFFIFSPVLGAALYVYLHLHIRKFAEAIAAPSAAPDGVRLENHLKSWLLTDYMLRQRRDAAIRDRPMDWLATVTTLVLVWLAGPYVLLHFWVRSWPAHAEWLSTGLLFCAMIAIYAGLSSWLILRREIGHKGLEGSGPVRAVLLVGVFIAGTGHTWVKTEWGEVRDFGPNAEDGAEQIRFWTSLSPINLNGLVVSTLPPDQLDYLAARRQYRITWCEREGYEMSVCGPFYDWQGDIPATLLASRTEWCSANSIDLTPRCENRFAGVDRGFSRDWLNFRAAQIASLSPPDLSSDGSRTFDLRNANFVDASLVGVDFSRSRLSGADLSGAQLQGANFEGAAAPGANFSAAQLHTADLRDATMRETIFERAQLAAVNANSADLTGAVFFEASLPSADFENVTLSFANLSRTDLRGAQLRSSLIGDAMMASAGLQGADVRSVDFRRTVMPQVDLSRANALSAQFNGVNIRYSTVREADLSRSDFSGADMTESLFDAALMFGVRLTGATGIATTFAGANLHGANLEGANFTRAAFVASNLHEVSLDTATRLQRADLRGASVRAVDADTATVLGPFAGMIFSTHEDLDLGSNTPDHWPEDGLPSNNFQLENSPFHIEWRLWQDSLLPQLPPQFLVDVEIDEVQRNTALQNGVYRPPASGAYGDWSQADPLPARRSQSSDRAIEQAD